LFEILAPIVLSIHIGVFMNIGCVVYKKDFESGTLIADWQFIINDQQVKGTGIATGNPGKNYEGDYTIVYYDSKGNQSKKYDLEIKNAEKFYTLTWYENKILKYVGAGMIYKDVLIAGWKRNQEKEY
jgi:hypothetical protein